MAETRAATAIGRQETADHAQRRGLARAVGTKKAAHATLADAETHVIDHGARPVTFHEIMDIDGECHGGHRGKGTTVTGRPGERGVCPGSGRASIRNTSLARALCE